MSKQIASKRSIKRFTDQCLTSSGYLVYWVSLISNHSYIYYRRCPEITGYENADIPG